MACQSWASTFAMSIWYTGSTVTIFCMSSSLNATHSLYNVFTIAVMVAVSVLSDLHLLRQGLRGVLDIWILNQLGSSCQSDISHWSCKLKFFSFIATNIEFKIYLNSFSPKSFTSGLWSVANVKLENLSRNNLAILRHQTTARDSPSTGAYPASALDRYLLPRSASRQSPLQHKEVSLPVLLQYYEVYVFLAPVSDCYIGLGAIKVYQSVLPSWHTISFDCLNLASSWSSSTQFWWWVSSANPWMVPSLAILPWIALTGSLGQTNFLCQWLMALLAWWSPRWFITFPQWCRRRRALTLHYNTQTQLLCSRI